MGLTPRLPGPPKGPGKKTLGIEICCGECCTPEDQFVEGKEVSVLISSSDGKEFEYNLRIKIGEHSADFLFLESTTLFPAWKRYRNFILGGKMIISESVKTPEDLDNYENTVHIAYQSDIAKVFFEDADLCLCGQQEDSLLWIPTDSYPKVFFVEPVLPVRWFRFLYRVHITDFSTLRLENSYSYFLLRSAPRNLTALISNDLIKFPFMSAAIPLVAILGFGFSFKTLAASAAIRFFLCKVLLNIQIL